MALKTNQIKKLVQFITPDRILISYLITDGEPILKMQLPE
jgi:hypothetical protein